MYFYVEAINKAIMKFSEQPDYCSNDNQDAIFYQVYWQSLTLQW